MAKFFGDRCTHLAGMIAYFGIFSIIPGLFLILFALTQAGQIDERSRLISKLSIVMPQPAVDSVLEAVNFLQAHSNSIGLIGGIGLVWGATNFFSCIESALNIIYGVENRWFFRQKAWVLILMLAAGGLMGLTAIGASFVIPIIHDAGQKLNFTLSGIDVGLSLLVSFLGILLFLLTCYRFLCNADLHVKDLWRGAVLGAIAAEISIHALSWYLTSGFVSEIIRAFAGAMIVFIWFYLMALVLLAGAVFNWWWGESKRRNSNAPPLGSTT